MMLFMLLLYLILSAVLLYFTANFIRLVYKLKGPVIFPLTIQDQENIKIFPQRKNARQSLKAIKESAFLYVIALMIAYGALIYSYLMSINTFILAVIPIINIKNLLNLFAIVDEGIVIGNKYIPWRKIKSFDFQPIDFNHSYYGYSKEINNGYELVIKKQLFSVSCIVTDEDTKHKLQNILKQNGIAGLDESISKKETVLNQ
ncbi:hypothetical protein M3603_06360 [Rummeliibacillus stabekisii]|uniref:hypothetical protein n=1 Tax=Rummeliibacillus stabekisii TaxID=241244 RepID=UPI00204175A9|nr:hypothetical protein [Rummeliibacillus stabekisii]MCM3316298.1 hypothetical protein [Rummeliibacillus stabekisii]